MNTRKAFAIDTLVLLEHARMDKKDAEAKRNQSADQCSAALNDTAAAQKEIKAAMEEMAEVRATLVASEARVRVSEHQVMVLSAEITLLESQVKSLTKEIDVSHKETSKVARDLVDTQHLLTKTKNEYKVYVAEAEPQIDKAQMVELLKEELRKLRLQLEEYDMKLAKAASDSSSGPMLLAGANKELARLRDKVLALESEVRTEREAKEEIVGDKLQLKALVASLQERHVILSTKMEDSESENRLLKYENESLRNVIENLEKININAKVAELTSREELARSLLSIVSEERMRKQVQQTVTALDADIVALQLRLREAQDTILELEMQLTGRKAEGAKEDFLKERVNCLIAQVTELTDTQAALRADNSRLEGAEKRIRAELSEAVLTVERLNGDMNKLKLAHGSKLACMARRIDEDVHFLMQERDQLQAELERYYGLPNPCGVGMVVEDGITKLDNGRSARVLMVTGLVPGLAAALSCVVAPGDLVLSIDGFGTLSMDLVDVKDRIAGPRGSRVSLKMLRPLDGGDTGIEYTIVLKRGAWGAEHAVVSPEDRDMLDKQRWPLPGALSQSEFNRQSINRPLSSVPQQATQTGSTGQKDVVKEADPLACLPSPMTMQF